MDEKRNFWKYWENIEKVWLKFYSIIDFLIIFENFVTKTPFSTTIFSVSGEGTISPSPKLRRCALTPARNGSIRLKVYDSNQNEEHTLLLVIRLSVMFTAPANIPIFTANTVRFGSDSYTQWAAVIIILLLKMEPPHKLLRLPAPDITATWYGSCYKHSQRARIKTFRINSNENWTGRIFIS